ncbi:MAG: ABC transporter permease [Planctomycetes bacterium]|jgi:ABC-type antimicrobial peptide transport system permease subunit|nr:ABC transporter permease [Planctomycetota bacterium]
MLVPLRYNLRSLFGRGSSTLLTICAIGATVAVLAGMLSLQQGFAVLFQERGRDDLAVFLRKGATSEGESGLTLEQCEILTKEVPEVERAADGAPLAGAELFLAVRLRKFDGGETNVAIRGVQPATFAIHGDDLRIQDGVNFRPGGDELIIGEGLIGRIADCRVGDTLRINTVTFRIVGTFTGKGGYRSEIWGDLDRLSVALQRPVRSRVLAKVRPETDLAAVQTRYESDLRVQPRVETEREYLTSQTGDLSKRFRILGGFLAVIMGLGAVFTGTNSMLSAIGARTHEIGILKAVGYRSMAIFLSFLGEALLLGVLGGLFGCLLVLPFQGAETGTMNQTFSEVTFAFRTTPTVLLQSITFAALLGLVGGLFPAWRAARMTPVQALRRS